MKKVIVLISFLLSVSFAQYPVTIENCGRTLVFEKAPERTIAMRSIAAEFMVKLGLQDKLIGAARIDQKAPADLAPGLATIPVLSEGSLSKEALFAAEPDFVLAAYVQYDFNVSSGMASIDELIASGAQVYVISANCASDPNGVTVENVYTDLLNLGKIFGIEAQAQQVVAGMQARLAEVAKQVSEQEAPTVAFLDIAENGTPVWAYANGIYKDLVEQAGGQNIFADQSEQFLEISAEEIALRNPDFFLIVDSPFGAPAAEKLELIYSTFPNATATKYQRAYIIHENNVLPGVRNIEAVIELARAFHPDVFGD